MGQVQELHHLSLVSVYFLTKRYVLAFVGGRLFSFFAEMVESAVLSSAVSSAVSPAA